jgi:hypothetical protein
MLTTPGVIYKFIFKNDFSFFNGVYKVIQTLTYEEAINLGADFFNDLYHPIGKTKIDLEQDSDLFRTDKILKLKNVLTEKELYIPNVLNAFIPDSNVKKYYKLVIDINIGIFDNIDKLNAMSQIMQEHISSATGITNKPELTSYAEVWLTESEYQLIDNARDESSKKIINYFSETIKMQREIDSLKTKVQYYENLIKSL